MRLPNHRTFVNRRMYAAVLVISVTLIAVIASGMVAAGSHAEVAPGAVKIDGPRPSWLRASLPDLAGTVLHWRQVEYQYSKGSPDPANGKMNQGDIWEQIGPDGTPTLFHGWYTLPDGSLLQEIYETPQTTILVKGPAYASVQPTLDDRWCVQQWSTSTGGLTNRLPQFVDERGISSAGYSLQDGAPSAALPTTPPQSGVNPTRTFNNPTAVHIWSQLQSSTVTHISRATTMDVDSVGRVAYVNWRTQAANGDLDAETWFAFGDLLAYPSNAHLPTAVFALPQQITGGCK